MFKREMRKKLAHPVNARCVLESVDRFFSHGVTTNAPERKNHVHELTV
jgi:hypothetical protein